MATCHILTDLAPTLARTQRIASLVAVLTKLGFTCKEYGKEVCDEFRAENLETQIGVAHGLYADYSDQFRARVTNAPKGDVIIATEAWHTECFRGLLAGARGRFEGKPVVEMWIDYPESFAVFRVFASRAAMNYTAGKEGNATFRDAWIPARPYFPAELSAAGKMDVYTVELEKPAFGTEHLERNRHGCPVIAPDWGIYSETVVHGLTGILYRSVAGREKAMTAALKLPSEPIVKWIANNFSLELAADQLSRYMERLANA